MVAAHANHETVFTVLGAAARRRGARSLAGQLILSLVTATTILVAAPHWWSLAFLAGWSAAYSAWGLLAHYAATRGLHARSFHALLVLVAGVGTALALAGVIGLGLALYTGDARGAKNSHCVPGSTSERCQARKTPPVTTGPIIR
jgi:hypothetical protein